MKPTIVIRADGGTSIGMGHVIRCLALADMLKDDFNISFAIQEPDENIVNYIHTVTDKIICLPQTTNYTEDIINFCNYLKPGDIVVLDGYHFKTNYQQAIKKKGCKLIAIDDLHAWHQLADVVINHADGVKESDYSKEKYTKLCLGLNFVLLRKEFLNAEKTPRIITSIKKIFISMGAADINNLTEKFTEALVQIKGIEEIHLMLSSINPNLKRIEDLIRKNNTFKIIPHFNISGKQLAELLKTCDICICPASSISLESCAIGIGLITGYTAENQKENLNGLIKHQALINFEDLNSLSVVEIKKRIEKIRNQPELINKLILNQKQMINGKSADNILTEFKLQI